MSFREGFNLSSFNRYGLLALLLITVVSAILAASVGPIKGRALAAAEFRESKSPGLVMLRYSKGEFGRERYGLPSRLWISGAPAAESASIEELGQNGSPAYRVRDEIVLYVNEAMRSEIEKKPGTVTLALDLPSELWRVAHIGGSVFLLWAMGLLMRSMKVPAAVGNAASQTKRLPALDSLRGIAAMSVFLLHALGVMYPGHWFTMVKGDPERFPTPLIGQMMTAPPLSVLLNGALMVHIFWVLSGFVLALPLLKKASYDLVAKSAVKRYFRLLPLVFVTTIGSFLLHRAGGFFTREFNEISRYGSGMFSLGGAKIQLSSALWESVSFGNGFNMPLWTIKLELFGSLLLFGVVAITLPVAKRVLVWTIVLVALIFVWPLDYLADFIAGLLLASIALSRPDFRIRPVVAWGILALAVAIGSFHMSRFVHEPWLAWFAAMKTWPVVLGAVLLVSLAVFSNAAIAVLSCRPLVWLGERSFALYVVHGLTLHSVGQGVAVACMRLGLSPLISTSFGLAVCIGATLWISDRLTHWIDWPSVNLSNRVGGWFMGPRTGENKNQIRTM